MKSNDLDMTTYHGVSMRVSERDIISEYMNKHLSRYTKMSDTDKYQMVSYYVTSLRMYGTVKEQVNCQCSACQRVRV